MKYQPYIPGRRSIRLKGYDYTQPGGYFITVCTRDRECLLGKIRDGDMILNHLGKIVLQVWNELPSHYPYVELDAFCVMPNHFHGVIIIRDVDDPDVGAGLRPAPTKHSAPTKQPTGTDPPNPITKQYQKRHGLPEVVRALKSFSARFINLRLDTPGNPVWQRNYYEHIIRDQDELNKIRQYIFDNPLKWESDQDNLANIAELS